MNHVITADLRLQTSSGVVDHADRLFCGNCGSKSYLLLHLAVVDIVRKIDWPKPFTARVMKTRFVNDWQGREAELAEPPLIERETICYATAMQSGDPDNTGVWVGEAAGLIHDVRPAADLLQEIVCDAERLLGAKANRFVRGT